MFLDLGNSASGRRVRNCFTSSYHSPAPLSIRTISCLFHHCFTEHRLFFAPGYDFQLLASVWYVLKIALDIDLELVSSISLLRESAMTRCHESIRPRWIVLTLSCAFRNADTPVGG